MSGPPAWYVSPYDHIPAANGRPAQLVLRAGPSVPPVEADTEHGLPVLDLRELADRTIGTEPLSPHDRGVSIAHFPAEMTAEIQAIQAMERENFSQFRSALTAEIQAMERNMESMVNETQALSQDGQNSVIGAWDTITMSELPIEIRTMHRNPPTLTAEVRAEIRAMDRAVEESIVNVENTIAMLELRTEIQALERGEGFSLAHVRGMIDRLEENTPDYLNSNQYVRLHTGLVNLENVFLSETDHSPPTSYPIAAQRYLDTLLAIRPTDLSDDSQECNICRESFLEGEEAEEPVSLPSCGHVFGRACIERWITDAQGGRTTCPLCRGVLFEVDTLALAFPNPFNLPMPPVWRPDALLEDIAEADYLTNLHNNTATISFSLSARILRIFRTFVQGVGERLIEIAEALRPLMGRLMVWLQPAFERNAVVRTWSVEGPSLELMMDIDGRALLMRSLERLVSLETEGES